MVNDVATYYLGFGSVVSFSSAFFNPCLNCMNNKTKQNIGIVGIFSILGLHYEVNLFLFVFDLVLESPLKISHRYES